MELHNKVLNPSYSSIPLALFLNRFMEISSQFENRPTQYQSCIYTTMHRVY